VGIARVLKLVFDLGLAINDSAALHELHVGEILGYLLLGDVHQEQGI
jgi:hypothetical protein